ncbi:MAG: hypothetical protein ABIP48_09680, partial [Planctomycetota bacterium]
KESEGWIPSKLFQYMGSGTPVLALVPEGDVADIVRETETGTVVPPEDVGRIKTAIRQHYDRYCDGGNEYQPNWELIEKYESRRLTSKLGECLDRATGRRSVEHSGSDQPVAVDR